MGADWWTLPVLDRWLRERVNSVICLEVATRKRHSTDICKAAKK